MCNPIRLAARPENCHAALVSLCDGRTAEVYFDADAGSLGFRDRLGVPLEPDEGPSVELVDVQIFGVSVIDTLSGDDESYIVDQLLGLDRPAPRLIPARRPTAEAFADEGARMLAVQQAVAMMRADDTAGTCDVIPFPSLAAVAIPEPPRAA
jgi:hypothetical protein